MKKIFSGITSLVAAVPASVLAFTGGGAGNTTNPPVVTSVSNVQDFYDIILIAARWLVVFGLII
ncbi:MAG: hypothetical protein Q8Q39_02690, partial [bacterium]|nr:hypothetical protein [bacterium]